MSKDLVCPQCGSVCVDCRLKPAHMHRCYDCGYDGTTTIDPDYRGQFDSNELTT